ncbi:hypothetical protein AB3466_14035 [Sphingobacterium thalpophilum]|uniref:hypothetical protein n=1 Tax=Sphingobacterium thalpophilum TaxID=259 RepID=UPI0037DA0EB2
MKEIRIQKINDFIKFSDSSEDIFKKFRDNDNQAEKFERDYMLTICPKGRGPHNNNRIVEIFWGARPYENQSTGKTWRSLVETGATLYFYRNDSGDVTVYLYPAKTENIQPIESLICLYRFLDPKELNKETFLKKLWDDFIAYMEVTSLDGNPTRRQRSRIYYLRNFKHLVIDKKWQNRRASDFLKDVLKWTFTVALSGIGIFFFALMNDSDKNFKESLVEIKKLNAAAENIELQLKILNTRDSLMQHKGSKKIIKSNSENP